MDTNRTVDIISKQNFDVNNINKTLKDFISNRIDVNIIKDAFNTMKEFSEKHPEYPISEHRLKNYCLLTVFLPLIEGSSDCREGTIYLILIAIYQDNYLDNKNIPKTEKEKFYRYLEDILLEKDTETSIDVGIRMIMLELYNLFINSISKNKKNIIKYMLRANKFQYKSYLIQQQNKYNNTIDINDITVKKSICSGDILLSMINKNKKEHKTNFERMHEIFFAIQNLDDLEDIKYDLKDNITTPFTKLIEEGKYVDDSLIDTIHQVDRLIKKYYNENYSEIFQLLLELVFHLVSRNKEYVSDDLYSKISNATYFDSSYVRNNIKNFIKRIYSD